MPANELRLLLRMAGAVLCIALLLLGAAPGRADIQIDREVMTVTTTTMTAVFRGPDLFRLSNKLTGEQYLYPTVPYRSMLGMGLVHPTGTPLHGDFWRKGKNELAAQYVMNDLARTVYVNVVIDPDTQDITYTLWCSSNADGLTDLSWGIRGLDLTGGRLIIPADGGRYVDDRSPLTYLSLPYPSHWEAQMAIWEGRLGGGFVVYSRDADAQFKDLHLTKTGDRLDVGFVTEATAPWERAETIPAVEWRINMYRGDWRVPARGYKSLMDFFRRPVKAAGSRAWVHDVRTVAAVDSPKLEPALLDALAKRLEPKKTLLYLTDWRRPGYDPNAADYTPRETVKPFVEKAHEMGFHVMLPVAPPGCDTASADFPAARRFLVKDRETGRTAVEPAPTLAAFNPASRAYRDLFIARLKVMMDDVTPDAILLPGAAAIQNDGNGLIENGSMATGMTALFRALLTAFPDMAFGAEGMNELISPYASFAARGAPGLPAAALAPHPISTALFGDQAFPFCAPESADADAAPAEYAEAFAACEGEGVAPTVLIHSAADLDADHASPPSLPGLDRALRLAHVWQQHDLLPDWGGDWVGQGQPVRFAWKGVDGSVAQVRMVGQNARLVVGDQTLYRRARGASSITTPLFIPGWPAWDDNSLFGLDPARDYWLEEQPRPKDAAHIAALGPGVRVEGAEARPAWVVFELDEAKKGTASGSATATIALPPGTQPLSIGDAAAAPTVKDGRADFSGLTLPAALTVLLQPAEPLAAPADLPLPPPDFAALSGGLPERAQPAVGPATCGGQRVERAVVASVPAHGRAVCTWYGKLGKLPDAAALTLSFRTGLADGSKGAGITFLARVNGETLWTKALTAPGWQSATVDLSRWKGQNALIQLVAVNGGDARVRGVCWTEVAVK